MAQALVYTSQDSSLVKCLRDLREGISNAQLWSMLAWQEILKRYRRSVLGPFWLTLSTGALLLGMGPLYGNLLHQHIADYFPYLATGYILWQLMNGLVNEGCYTFIGAEGLIKQNRMPLSVHVLRVVTRNLIIFGHHLLILLVVFVFFPPPLSWALLTVPLAVFAIAANGLWICVLMGMLCARYRDTPPLIASLMQIAFFLTPVLWRRQTLSRYQWLVDANPLHHFLDIARAPLITGAVPVESWLVIAGITVAGYAAALAVFVRFRSQVALWV